MRVLNQKALRVLVSVVLAVAPVGARAQHDEMLTLDIEAQQVGSALVTLAKVSGVQIMLSAETGEKVEVEGLKGEYRFEDALTALLANTGLAYEFASENLVVVKEAAVAGVETADRAPVEDGEGPIELPVETMIVTGTRLPLGDPTARVVTITAEDIAKRGVSSVEDVLRTIPQIFSTINNTTHMHWPHVGDTLSLGALAVGITTANLRGFGSTNTLVLLNGHRVAGTAGHEEFFVNLRHMPAGAVERIEVNLDGGSSVYGSDGIAGIINVITRKDFAGGKVTIRNEQSSTGADQTQLSGYYGYNWGNGSVSANLSHTESEPYSARKAGFYTRDWSFMFGGHQSYNFNSAHRSALLSTSMWGPYNMILPRGHDGRNARPEDFRFAAPEDVIDEPDLDAGGATYDQSVVLNFEQTVADRLRLRGEYYRTEARTSTRLTRHTVYAFTVPASNAFNNFGQDVYVRYNPRTETDLGLIPPPEQSSTTVSDRIVAGFDVDLGESLRLSVDWLSSNSNADMYQYMMTHDVHGPLADEEHTARVWKYLASPDPHEAINLFGDGTGQNATFSEMFGINKSTRRGTGITKTEAYLTGRLVNLPAGAISFVLGGEVRNEGVSDEHRTSDGRNINVVEVGLERPYRKLAAYYGELSIPILRAASSGGGPGSLVFIGSVRRDEYTVEGAKDWDGLGDPNIGKVNVTHTSLGYGFRWELTDTFLIRWAFDSGSRAPTVSQLFGRVSRWPNGLTYDPLIGDWVRAYLEIGPSPNVKPEYSDNLAYGFEWRPAFARGLSITLDHSSIDLQDRIADSRELGSLLPPEVYGMIPQIFVRDPTGTLLEHYVTPTNIGRSVSRTWDLQISWRFVAERFGSFTPSVYYHYVEDMFDQAVPGSEKVRLIGTSYGVDKRKIKARLEWKRDAMTVNLSYDYTPAYLSNANCCLGDQPVESRYTIDLSTTYRWASGLLARVGGRNILDADFPFVLNKFGKPFDPVRVDVRGRVWFFELSSDF